MNDARSAWPRSSSLLLLTAFLGAATVPALLSWTSHDQGRVLRSRQAELDELLRLGNESRRESLPSRLVEVVSGEPVAELVRIPHPDGAGLRFMSELLFSDAQIALFQQKSQREGEFERALKPPGTLTATASRDGTELVWASPPDLAVLRASLSDQPLLRLGFRVYRWRESEQPKLLATLEGLGTTFKDRDLPLWRERFFYCVATVLEGTIGDLPTLIESRQSPVQTVETLENFKLDVLGAVEGDAGRARLGVSVWIDGDWSLQEVAVAVGERVVAPARGRALDTGLVVKELHPIEGEREETVERPEFLPDGRRKLDPDRGLPTFHRETVVVPTRALTVDFQDASGATRTITSAEQT